MLSGESNHTAPRTPAAPPPISRRQWLILCAVGVGSLLGSIDNNVVNIALPTIRHQFAASVAHAEWVVALYLLTAFCCLLPFGRLGDLLGEKPIYVTGYLLFVLSSALCGLAPGVNWLIFFRGLQGIGAAMIFAISPAILTTNFPPALRGRVLGLQAVMVYLGSTTGPMLGGWLTESLGWRSIFYVNVPIGLTAMALAARFVPRQKPARHNERFDAPGAALFMAAFALLLFGMNQGHAYGWFSASIAALFSGALLLLGLFLWTERRSPSPLLDLTLFRSAPFALCSLSAVSNYIGLFTISFLMPFYLIQGRGLSPSRAGALMTLQPILMMLSAPLSGALSDRIGTRLPSVLGMGLQAVAMGLLARLDPGSSQLYIGATLALAGLAAGVFVAPNDSTLMGSAPRNRQGIASGVLATSRLMGMILGVGVSGAIFTTFLHSARPLGFFEGVQISFLVACLVSVLGCMTSFVRKSS